MRAAQRAGIIGFVSALLACGGSETAQQDSGLETTGDALADAPLVEIEAGRLEGQVRGHTQEFLGIPYAKPPIDALRFAPPEPAASWDGVRDATELGPKCPQPSGGGAMLGSALPTSEDCLSLNVYAPAQASDSGRAVMVFIHGGSFNSGSGGEYDGRVLSEAGDVIVVTLNYRLGALAFLVHPDLDAELGVPSGNLGIRDQQLALRWVRDNIARFGGDPDRVTIFGESAGGHSACMHMFAHGSRALAQRFILESGTCLQHPAVSMKRANLEWVSGKLIADLCAADVEPIECLRALSPDELVSWAYGGGMTDPGPDPLGQNFLPYVDGDVFEQDLETSLQLGDYHHGEVLLGTMPNEAQMFRLAQSAQTIDTVSVLSIYGSYVYPTSWSAIEPLYHAASDDDALDAFERLTTDTWFRCPARTTARELADRGSDVFLYSFELAPAVHTQELDYVFGYPVIGPQLTAPPLPSAAPVPPVDDLVQAIQGYWTRFAKTGDPNGGELHEWPAYASDRDEHLVLDDDVRVESGLAREPCDAWDAAYTPVLE